MHIFLNNGIHLQSICSTIQSAVDDAIITISQYFHIPNIRLNCILENQPGESRQESIIELNGKKYARCVCIFYFPLLLESFLS